MRIVVLGSSGQVGSEFKKQFDDGDLVCLDHEALDVTDAVAVGRVLSDLTFDVCVTLAAFHDVGGCEEDPRRGFLVNAVGAHNVARVCSGMARTVCYISSDYVFGGDEARHDPYLEDDEPHPLNVYGASKAAGEMLVRAAGSDHLVVRSSSLFGVVTSRKGHTFPEMILARARSGSPLKVVDDQVMSPTYTLDLVHGIRVLLEAGVRGTVHVAGSGQCSWYEFAAETLRLAGVSHPVEACSSEAFPSSARRPAFSVLASHRWPGGVERMRGWQEALKAYLVEKGEIETRSDE